MQTATHTDPPFSANTLQTPKNLEEQLLLKRFSQGQSSAFWELWQRHRDYLYYRCLGWMGGNLTNAEDALSRVMLKAWEKVQKYAGKITNFKAWLTKLTDNLCVDIHREHSRDANRVENIEVYANTEELGLASLEDTPESAMDTSEKRIVIRRAIDNLSPRLRETFILRFYEELSYQEISQQQDISYDNVCKRISQARGILRLELRGYFIGEDEIDTELSVTSTLTTTESAIEEISKGNAEVEPIEVALLVQHSESAHIVTPLDGKLEVERDNCHCVEATLCEFLPTPILVLTQLDGETGSWGNPCLAVQRMQQQPLVGKRWGEFVPMSRSPPLYCHPYFQSFSL